MRWYDLSRRQSDASKPRKEGTGMTTVTSKSRNIDFSKLTFAKVPVSTAEAIKDVAPMRWPEDVCSGNNHVTITHVKKEIR